MGNFWSCMENAICAICGEEETNVVSSAPERDAEPPSICGEEETIVVSSAPERAPEPPTIGGESSAPDGATEPPSICDEEETTFVSSAPDRATEPPTTSLPHQEYDGEDVFLSHSGWQKDFVRQLYTDLTREGVSCFFDESRKSLPLAEKWASRIFKAAEKCRVAVLLLSDDFIRSKWPMLELSAFVKAKSSKNPNLKILPVFYKIAPRNLKDPTSIPDPTRSEISEKTRNDWKDISKEERKEWEEALREVRGFNGLSFKKGGDKVNFRGEIIKEIRKLLLPSGSVGLAEGHEKVTLPLPQPAYPAGAVGIEKQVIEVINKLNLNSEDESPHAVVIYGVGGIGKTTLANAVVNQLNLQKYNYARVEMDEVSARNDLKKMQEQILKDAFPKYYSGIKIKLRDYREGQERLGEAFQCLGNKPIFLFIDNALRKEDMENLLPVEFKSLPKRSRVLLTTRNLKETDFCEERGLKLTSHLVVTLPDDKAIQILCKDAAKRELIKDNDMERILQICSGIPLVLKIVGAYLRKMEYKVDKCTQILESLEHGKKIKDANLSERLIDSVYRQLEDFAQEGFLDICCFFNKRVRREVEWIVGAETVRSLIDAALVNSSDESTYKYMWEIKECLTVHDVVRAKGRSMSGSTRIMDWKGWCAATEDQRKAEAIRGVWLENDQGVLDERLFYLMKDSLRILALGEGIFTNGGILMNFKELRYLQICNRPHYDSVKYYGPVFKEDVSMYKKFSLFFFGPRQTLTSMAQTSTAVAASMAQTAAVAGSTFGIEEQVIEVINKLNLNSEDALSRAVVIYGVEGIGKTTLANAVVAQLNLEKYRYVRFDMDEEYDNNYSWSMVAQLNPEKYSYHRYGMGGWADMYGILLESITDEKKEALEWNKPVFLIIDNVRKDRLAVNLGRVVNLGSLPKRSRVLMTTRDLEETDFCEELGLKRRKMYRTDSLGVELPHRMNTLPDDQAVKILFKDATNCELINDNDVKRILQICGGIPLVLKLVGAYLKMMEYNVVKCAQILESLEQQGKQSRYENLSELLTDSLYSQLKDFAQEAFLDICCFFNKWHRQQVEYIVGAEAVGCLIDAGLVNTSVRTDREMYYGGLVMGEELLTVHDVVRAKGRSMATSTRIKIIEGFRFEWDEATRDQRTAEAIKGVWFKGCDIVEEGQLNMMKDSLRFLVMEYGVLTTEIEMNLKELRYLQVGYDRYHGLIFKEGVRMFRGLGWHYFLLQK